MAGRRGRQVKKESNSRVGVSLLLPGPCLAPWGSPTLPRSSTRAVSPCPSSAAAAPVSSSPQPCRAWPGVPQSQACPCSHFLAWPCPTPVRGSACCPELGLPWCPRLPCCGAVGLGQALAARALLLQRSPALSGPLSVPSPHDDVMTFPAVTRGTVFAGREVTALF